ncbi:hypothetical protein RI570_00185 [Brucella pseudogrignonensis]|uniref:hypothetical protein n=1 Tax=Brucella pseudogrignonensis TaxID=419475 RepID=UPI0028B3692A|nr:hypothetical protein [Brucella pseudogrignonensis]MDT6938579.1 hypothetical protein [Brucella pseudogrignonensis]
MGISRFSAIGSFRRGNNLSDAQVKHRLYFGLCSDEIRRHTQHREAFQIDSFNRFEIWVGKFSDSLIIDLGNPQKCMLVFAVRDSVICETKTKVHVTPHVAWNCR